MDSTIIAAIIGAVGAVIAAILGAHWFARRKKEAAEAAPIVTVSNNQGDVVTAGRDVYHNAAPARKKADAQIVSVDVVEGAEFPKADVKVANSVDWWCSLSGCDQSTDEFYSRDTGRERDEKYSA